MGFDLWLIYASTIFLASIVPGPSMILALTCGLRYGKGRALFAGFGNVAATMIQANLSIAGLGMLLLSYPAAFMAIKYMGAAYLAYLGIKLLRAPAGALSANSHDSTDLPRRSLFAQGFLVAMGNPKAVIFFTALFPQFLDTNGVTPASYLVLTITLAAIALACFMVYAFGGQSASRLLDGAKGTWMGRILGGGFLGAGAVLAFSDE